MKHAIARLRWLPPNEGGRPSPVSATRYMSPVVMEGIDPTEAAWTLVVNRSEAAGGDDETVLVHFLMEDAPHDLLKTGTAFRLLEGARTVAEGIVSEVFELSAAA